MAQLMIDDAGTVVVPDVEAAARRPVWWVESLLVVWLAWLYDVVNNFAPLRPVAPYNHALGVLHLEQRLRLSPESMLNAWLAAHHTTGWWAANYYDIAHYTVTFAILGWLWWRRPDLYRPLRRGLVLVNLLGFVIFWCYPMAPPRMTPGQGFVDVVATTHAFGSSHSGTLARAANELAAMPSLHIAWAMWSSLVLWRMYRHRRWTPLVLCYPVATAVTVVATGNHFLTDIVAGALTLIAATLVAEWWYPRVEDWWQQWKSSTCPPPQHHPEPRISGPVAEVQGQEIEQGRGTRRLAAWRTQRVLNGSRSAFCSAGGRTTSGSGWLTPPPSRPPAPKRCGSTWRPPRSWIRSR